MALTGLGDYNQAAELDVMGGPVPDWEVEGIGDSPEIPGSEVCGRDWKEGDGHPTHGAIGSRRGMVVGACWQRCADIGRKLGNWVRDRKNYVEIHSASLCEEVSGCQNCTR